MKKLDSWLRKRKSRKDQAHSVDEDQHAGAFPTGIGNLLEERRKERDIEHAKAAGLKDAKVSSVKLPSAMSIASVVTTIPRKPVLLANPPHRHSKITSQHSGRSEIPFRASNTLKAMISYAVSLPQVQQQSWEPRKVLPMHYGKSDMISQLTPDLTFYLMDFLDDFDNFNLKLSNRRLYATISLNHLPEDTRMELARKYHEHNYSLSGTTVLTPKQPIDEVEMEAFHKKRQHRLEQTHSMNAWICGSCCDFLFRVPGVSPKEVCRCGDPSFSPSDVYTDWCVAQSQSNSIANSLSPDKNGSRDVDILQVSRKAGGDSDGFYVSNLLKEYPKSRQKEATKHSKSTNPVVNHNSWPGSLDLSQERPLLSLRSAAVPTCKTRVLPTQLKDVHTSSDTSQELPKSKIQEEPQTIIIPQQRRSVFSAYFAPSGNSLQQTLLPFRPTPCSKCLTIPRWEPECPRVVSMCHCSRAGISKIDVAAFSLLNAWGMARKICPNCRHKKVDSSERVAKPMGWRIVCGCTTFPQARFSMSRKTCSICHRFTEKKPWPNINPVEEMCQCSTSHYSRSTSFQISTQKSTIPPLDDIIPPYLPLTALAMKAMKVAPCLLCKRPIHPSLSVPESEDAFWCKCHKKLTSPAAPLNITSSRLTCVTCESTRIGLGVTSASKTCQCLNISQLVKIPITSRTPQTSIPCETPVRKPRFLVIDLSTCQMCMLYILPRYDKPKASHMAGSCRCIPEDLVPSSGSFQGRDVCNVCKGFAKITPGITLVARMCRCRDGPLIVRPPEMHKVV